LPYDGYISIRIFGRKLYMLKKLVVTGCIEAVLLAAVAMVRPEFIQQNAVWIAIGALLILLLIAAYDAIKNAPKTERPAGNSTSGDHSPAFGSVGRDVHITNYGQHQHQPRTAAQRRVRGSRSRMTMTQDTVGKRFDRLLKAMVQGEPPKAKKGESAKPQADNEKPKH
jgi:hypothetical protein